MDLLVTAVVSGGNLFGFGLGPAAGACLAPEGWPPGVPQPPDRAVCCQCATRPGAACRTRAAGSSVGSRDYLRAHERGATARPSSWRCCCRCGWKPRACSRAASPVRCGAAWCWPVAAALVTLGACGLLITPRLLDFSSDYPAPTGSFWGYVLGGAALTGFLVIDLALCRADPAARAHWSTLWALLGVGAAGTFMPV